MTGHGARGEQHEVFEEKEEGGRCGALRGGTFSLITRGTQQATSLKP